VTASCLLDSVPLRSSVGGGTYAPTENSPDEVKDQFFEQLDATISTIRSHDTLLILGDLNATTGKVRVGFESVVGRFGSGGYEQNDNSLRMLSLSLSVRLYV